MKLSTKIASSMGFLAVLLGILGLYLLVQMTKINDTATLMANDRLPLVTALGEINNASSEFRLAEVLHVYAASAADKRKYEERMDKWIKSISDSAEQAAKLIRTPDAKQAFNTYLEARAKYRAEMQKVLKLSRDNNTGEAAVLLMGQSREQYRHLSDALDAAIKAVMQDTDYMERIYESTDEAGFRVVTWYNAGTRNFYGKSPIKTPEDLKGKKIRVQQSPASVAMVKAFDAAAAPMGFGEVYTAIQQGVIDGAENNELALTNNKHGEVAKYYSYNKHQMVPDMLVANLKFLNSLSDEDYQIFKEAAALSTEVELEEWEKSAEEAKRIAAEDMGVEFIDVDVDAFKQKVLPLHDTMLQENEKIRDFYDHIQEVNQKVKGGE